MRRLITDTAPGCRIFQRWFLGLALSCFASTSLAVPISSEIFTRARVQLATTVAVDDEETIVDSQGALLDPLSAFALATVTDGTDTATARIEIDASWTNANQGTVAFDELYETVSPTGFVQGNVTPFGRFSYSFLADADGTLSVAYDRNLAFEPNLLGTGTGYIVTVSGFRLFRTGTGVTDPGVFTFDLLEGNAYTLRIQSGMGLGGNIGRRSASSQGVFDWRFEPAGGSVPVAEPGALGMLGLGLLGSLFARTRTPRARACRVRSPAPLHPPGCERPAGRA